MSDSKLETPLETPATQDEVFDLLVVGAGPTGLACAIEAQKAGLRAVMVDKGCVCNSLFHYPAHMTFFTTPELLEIGGIPFPSTNTKPNRNEALQYYRRVADLYKLDIRQYHRVERVEGRDGAFIVHTVDRFGRSGTHSCPQAGHRHRLLRPAQLPPHSRREPEQGPSLLLRSAPLLRLDVLVVGGKNSAAIAALELWRSGARVTLVHRDSEIDHQVKYWIKPDIEKRIQDAQIDAYFSLRAGRNHTGHRCHPDAQRTASSSKTTLSSP